MKIFLFFLLFPALSFGQLINQAEYFFDIDPGIGNGSPFTIGVPASTVNFNQTVSTSALGAGNHVMFVRFRDNSGSWSLYEGRMVTIQDTLLHAYEITEAEYFFNTDPGFGNGTPINISNPNALVTENPVINTSALQPGTNILFTRFRDDFGAWSLYEGRLIFLQDTSAHSNTIVKMEYFIDTIGAIGTGTPVAVNTPSPTATILDNISVSTLGIGNHYINVRVQNDNGVWSLYEPRNFSICTVYGPLSIFDTYIEENTVSFTNNSENVDQFQWKFGDNTSDNLKINPAHDYQNVGPYTVQLITSNVCGNDTLEKIITIDGLSYIKPNYAGNTGFVSTIINGYGFTSGADIRLIKSGEADIVADSAMLIDDGNYRANFIFANSPTGLWHLVIDDPGGLVDTLFNAFEIQTITPFDPWFEIIGPSGIRSNSNTRYQIAVGNNSNITQYGIPVNVFLDSTWQAVISTSLDNDSIPQVIIDSLPPISLYTDSVTGKTILMGNIMIMKLGPGEVEYIEIIVNSPTIGSYEIIANIGQPLFDPSQFPLFTSRSSSASNCQFLPPCVDCLFDLLGLIPVAGCATGAFNLGCTIGNNINDPSPKNAVSLVETIGKTILGCVPASAVLGKAVKAAKSAMGAASSASSWNDQFTKCPATCDPDPNKKKPVGVTTSKDPNVKEGPSGITSQNFISGKEPIFYSIYFENVDTATAPAAEVVITDQLDTSMFDLSTIQYINYGFGDTILEGPGKTSRFVRDLDLSVSHNIILRTEAALDTESGSLIWRFSSFDTDTFAVTNDPTLGFLPPNVNKPEGEGFVRFSIDLKPGYQHQDVINNTASITFDSNSPILTPVWINTIDIVKPVSQVLPLPVTQNDSSFVVRWSGSDADAGILSYDVYVSINDSAYQPWYGGIEEDSAVYHGIDGYKYEFYSIAVDRVHNVEDAPVNPDTNPDAVTTVNVQVGVEELATENLSLIVIPNPVQNKATASFKLPESANTNLDIYDLSGRKVVEVFNGALTRGMYNEDLPISELSNGIYFIQLSAGSKTKVSKFVIAR
jgi:PKD repeat protein